MNISLQPLFLPFRKNHWLQVSLILLVILGLCYFFAFPAFAADTPTDGGANPDTVKAIESSGFFSGILTYFMDALKQAGKRLQPFALTLGSFLMMIQIGTTWTLYEGQLRMFELIKEIISFSFILFLILNFDTLADTFIQGWQFFGGIASGLFVTGTPVEAMTKNPAYDPSGLIDSGWAVVGHVITSALSISHPIDSLFILICGMGAYLGLVFMALQVTITLIEYYMVTSLGVILLPFGMLRYTKFLYSQLVKGFFTFGIKLMTVYFICGLAGHVMTGLGKIMVAKHEQATSDSIVAASGGMLNDDIAKIIVNPDYFDKSVNYGDVLNFMLFYIIMGYLVWKIPNLVSAMVSGSPQMDAGSVLRSAIGGAGMVAAGVAGAAAGTAHLAGNVAGTWAATGASGSGGGDNSAVQAATSVASGTSGGIPLSPDGPATQANGMNGTSQNSGGDSGPSASLDSAASSNSSPADSAASSNSDTSDSAASSNSSTSDSAASSNDGQSNPGNESEKATKQAEEGTNKAGAPASSAAPSSAKAAPSQAQSAPSSSWARRAAPSSPEERAKSSHLGRFARAMVLQGLAGSSLVKHFQHGLQESAYNASVADQMHNNLHQYLTNPQGYRFHDDGGDV